MEVDIHGTQFAVVDDHYRQFWTSVSNDEWEPGTLLTLRSALTPSWQYYDIGSWIGPMALYAAALGAEVFSFEPDPLAYKRIAANIELNPTFKDRIHCLNAAVGTADGEIELFTDALGNSQTSIFQKWARQTGTIFAENRIVAKMIDFHEFYRIHSNDHPQMFKIDIEGGEFALVPEIAKFILKGTPTVIHLSTHTFNLTEDDPDIQARIRQEGKATLFEPFLHLHWYVASKTGFRKLDPLVASKARIAAMNQPDELIFSTFELPES